MNESAENLEQEESEGSDGIFDLSTTGLVVSALRELVEEALNAGEVGGL